MADYKLGTYTFETEADFNTARKEVALIKQIKEKYDLSNPKILDAIVIKFKPQTAIGKDFINAIERKRMEYQNADILSAIDNEIMNAAQVNVQKTTEQVAATVPGIQNTVETKEPDEKHSIEETKSSTNDNYKSDNPIWYFQSASHEKKGPYTEKQIEELANRGELSKNTAVWRKDWENDKWLNVGKTSLRSYIKEYVEIDKLPREQRVSNKLLWYWAAVPFLFMVLSSIIFPDNNWGRMLINAAINTAFFAADILYLKKNGINISAVMWAGFILVPIYIFVRINKTTKRYGAGFMWIASYVLGIIAVFVIAFISALKKI